MLSVKILWKYSINPINLLWLLQYWSLNLQDNYILFNKSQFFFLPNDDSVNSHSLLLFSNIQEVKYQHNNDLSFTLFRSNYINKWILIQLFFKGIPLTIIRRQSPILWMAAVEWNWYLVVIFLILQLHIQEIYSAIKNYNKMHKDPLIMIDLL